jgi:hypothetical protein
MINPLRTPDDYALFIYTLVDQFPTIQHSTVTFVRLGTTLARVEGELDFEQDIRLPPDIKHHRIPAPAMSFTQPNLPVLIAEVETLLDNVQPTPDA